MQHTIQEHRVIIKGKRTALRCVIELGSMPQYYFTTAFSQPAEHGMRISNRMTSPEGELFIKGLKQDLADMQDFAETVIEIYKAAYLNVLITWRRNRRLEEGRGE